MILLIQLVVTYNFCLLTHTFRNGRIVEILPLMLWGLGGLLCEVFCNTVDELVGVVQHALGADPEAALDEQVVMDLVQLAVKVCVC